MKLGIVGHAAEKFDAEHEKAARWHIRYALTNGNADDGWAEVLVSGRSPMGGIDVWAEEIAAELLIDREIYPATRNRWDGPGGFKARNLEIARASDHVLVIVVEKLPDNFKGGITFTRCYHCREKRPQHMKSGGCWTAIQAEKMGKTAQWVILS